MNISRTDKAFDMRFSQGAQNRLVLHSEQVSSKLFKPFLRKIQITVILSTFLVLFGWSKFFLDDPALKSKTIYWCLTRCKKSEISIEPLSRKLTSTYWHVHRVILIFTTWLYFAWPRGARWDFMPRPGNWCKTSSNRLIMKTRGRQFRDRVSHVFP